MDTVCLYVCRWFQRVEERLKWIQCVCMCVGGLKGWKRGPNGYSGMYVCRGLKGWKRGPRGDSVSVCV